MLNILAKDPHSRARAGVLHTPSGRAIETPAYAIVGTHAEVRTLSPEDLGKTKTQLVIANTYHLWKMLGKSVDSFEGVHEKMGWDGAIMTDSGGFQVFSLGAAREDAATKFGRSESKKKENLVRMNYFGARFRDGEFRGFLAPAKSMELQKKLGADIVFAFDECTSPFADEEYQKKALRRTHRWAKICVKKKSPGQLLYGIVQGGKFEGLRKESAKAISSMGFDGIGIGGSFSDSFGDSREGMARVLDWIMPLLPEEKPRHLLGIGSIEDVFEGVERGVDTFDCVIPTREGRHGGVWTRHGRLNILGAKYINDKSPLDSECACEVCREGMTRGELRELFKAKDYRAGRLATFHNVYFFNDLMAGIRKSIREGDFSEFKKKKMAEIGS